MGTVFNTTSRCFEQPSPAILKARLLRRFEAGEAIFEASFVSDPESPFGGLGPVYNQSSCIACHPGYGRARRVDDFATEFGNGYTIFVHRPDGRLVDGYTFMAQTKAIPPYVPPARDVSIVWTPFVDEYGNRYPDGTPYNQGKPTEGTLIQPVADLVAPLHPLPDDYRVSLEATIGIYGTGLLDAISDADIRAEHARQQAMAGPVKGQLGPTLREDHDGREHLGRFTWHNTRATLQNGPGLNGLYNVTNVTRADRPQLFATQAWLDAQARLGLDVSALAGPQPAELSQEDLEDLMIWHRGLAVPAARDIDSPVVQRGYGLFQTAGCAACHKPSWVTGDYPFLPGYSRQKIWPYTDLLLHDMGEENRGRFRTFRTPPLWGRGLMRIAADHSDMFHDLRARDFEEAILWHFGEAKGAREAFRNLSAYQRAALIRFLEAI